MNQWTHIPVLAKEAAELLLRKPDGVYVDGTLGLGGHAAYFLSLLGPQARLFGFDKDEEALAMARTRVNDPAPDCSARFVYTGAAGAAGGRSGRGGRGFV